MSVVSSLASRISERSRHGSRPPTLLAIGHTCLYQAIKVRHEFLAEATCAVPLVVSTLHGLVSCLDKVRSLPGVRWRRTSGLVCLPSSPSPVTMCPCWQAIAQARQYVLHPGDRTVPVFDLTCQPAFRENVGRDRWSYCSCYKAHDQMHSCTVRYLHRGACLICSVCRVRKPSLALYLNRDFELGTPSRSRSPSNSSPPNQQVRTDNNAAFALARCDCLCND